MPSQNDEITPDIAREILQTKKRPVVVVEGYEQSPEYLLEIIFAERVKIAQDKKKLASESETLWYLCSKGEEELGKSYRRFVPYLFRRWATQYEPELLKLDSNEVTLDEIELIELQSLRSWLYDESIRLMKAGITTPGLDSIV